MNHKQILKTLILMPALLSFSTVLISQVHFDKGYFITKDGQKKECLIKNLDSRNNPHSFAWKLTDDGKESTLFPADAKEVGILGYTKFISAMVKIDRSNDHEEDLSALSPTRAPQWSDEELFLKVIIDGQAAVLYSYSEPAFVRFFYSTGNAAIEQLVYKPYMTGESTYDYNRDYLNQLNISVNCGPGQQPRQPGYNENDLKRYFSNFNACKGSPVGNTINRVKAKHFSFAIMAGVENASLQAEDFLIRSITHFDSKTSPFAGAELEYTTPSNKNRLSFLLDIYNDNYSSTGTDSLGKARITYGTIASAIGPRYRFFINDDLSIFVDAMAVLEFRTSNNYQWMPTKPNYLSNGYSLDIRTYAPVIAFGAGCAYKDVSAEFRYLTTKEIFPEYQGAGSNFKRVALILKYRIFKF